MLDPLYEAIAWLLSAFYSLVPDLGVSIILLTFAVMLLLFPLTQKQAKSMIAMQRVQPEVKKLQAKYKNDRQKLNEEMMKFYQEQKINPLAGCLPLLLQLPIFFALFNVLRDAQKHVPKDGALFNDLCNGFGNLCGKDATARQAAELGFDKGDTIVHHLGFLDVNFLDLQLSATDSHGGILDALPYFVLVGLVILCGWLQTRQSQKRTPAANKQMGMLMRILPIFFGLISLQFPAGLVLYFFVSSLWRLGQQEVIFRRFGAGITPGKSGGGGAIDVSSRDKSPGGKPGAAKAAIEAEEPSAPTAPEPRAPSAPTPSAPAQGSQARGGGLRGRMGLPPPPDPNGGGAAATRAPAQQRSGGSGSPPPQRRRNKKKRKR